MIPYIPASNSRSFLGLKKGSKLTSCGTIPIDALTCRGFLSKSKPQTFTVPEVLITVPPRIFIKVDLPAPFGPKRPKISPSFTSKFKLFNALIVVEPFFEYILLKFFTDKTFFFSILNYKFIT